MGRSSAVWASKCQMILTAAMTLGCRELTMMLSTIPIHITDRLAFAASAKTCSLKDFLISPVTRVSPT